MSTLSCQSASNGDKVVTSEQSLYECMSAALRQTLKKLTHFSLLFEIRFSQTLQEECIRFFLSNLIVFLVSF